MSRNLDSHQFSNVPVGQAAEVPHDVSGRLGLPGGVFKSSGLDSRLRLIFRSRARPIVLQGGGDRINKYTGTVIYIFDARQQFAITDYDISRTNSIVGAVLTSVATNNFFNDPPFKFGIFHITDADTPLPLYDGALSNTYEFLTEEEVGDSLSAQEVKDFIDELATGVSSIEAIRAPDPDGTVKTYVQSNYGPSAWYESGVKVSGTPRRSDINTAAVPFFGADVVNLGVQDAFHISMKYGAPLLTLLSSVPSPVPAYFIGANYAFQRDTDAT